MNSRFKEGFAKHLRGIPDQVAKRATKVLKRLGRRPPPLSELCYALPRLDPKLFCIPRRCRAAVEALLNSRSKVDDLLFAVSVLLWFFHWYSLLICFKQGLYITLLSEDTHNRNRVLLQIGRVENGHAKCIDRKPPKKRG